MQMHAQVFLSYSSVDAALARRLAVDLRHLGLVVWIDQWDLSVGEQIEEPIEAAVDAADLVLVLVSEASIASGWVLREWQRKGVAGGQVLPVRCVPCQMPDALASQDYVDVAGGAYWPGVSQLAQRVGVAPPQTHSVVLPTVLPLPTPITVHLGSALSPAFEKVAVEGSPANRAVSELRHRIEAHFGVPPPGLRLVADTGEMIPQACLVAVEEIPQDAVVVADGEDPLGAVIRCVEKIMVLHVDRFIDPDLLHRIYGMQGINPHAPARATWGELTAILRDVLRQGMGLHDLRALDRVLPSKRSQPLDTTSIAENLRPTHAVRFSQLAARDGVIGALKLDARLEAYAMAGLQVHPEGRYFHLDPRWIDEVRQAIQRMATAVNASALIVEEPDLRRFMERLHAGALVTLARRDLAPGVSLQVLHTVPQPEGFS